MESKPTSSAMVATKFAAALVEGDFDLARSLLAPDLRRRLSTDDLRDELVAMYRGYANGPPTRIHFDEATTMTDWPDKQPGDMLWAYVGIEGNDFVEAVVVIVADVAGEHLIRQIEWGRP